MNIESIYDLFVDTKAQNVAELSEVAAKARNDQSNTLFRRCLATAYKGAPITTYSKMSQQAIAEADEILKNEPIESLLRIEADLRRGFTILGTSPNSQKTYGALLRAIVKRAKSTDYWSTSMPIEIQNQCRPPRHLSGRRHPSDLPLTARSGQYEQYRLTEAETPPKLQTDLADFYTYLVAPVYPKRTCDAIKENTAKNYLKEIRLALGHFHHVLGIPLNQLSLETLFPLITRERLQGLSQDEQDEVWDETALHLTGWINEYFQMIKERNNSLSPHTKAGKISVLKRLGQYLYRNQVRRKRDYDSIPIFMDIDALRSAATKEVKHCRKARIHVSDQSRKWPDVVEGETTLTTLCRTVVEPLRLETRPRRKNGAWREGDVIAKSLQHFLKWYLPSDRPARRQQVYRDARIALSCPVVRPATVPPDGCYFPLPPNTVRDKNPDGTMADNYLYKTYSYEGKPYPEPIWVLDLGAHKTEEIYGPYSMIIPNRQFEDGTCFYDYLEHYLLGWWMEGKFQDRDAYTWWDPTLQGKVGHWISKGWMEFNPVDLELVEEPRGPLWRWGYLFPLPENGKHADGTSFAGSFMRTSYRLIGKRITPHLLRKFWATWAFQVGLSDRELESLAYAMGHSVKTLRTIYEQCTPEEKLRPIFEAIDRIRINHLIDAPTQSHAETNEQMLVRLTAELKRLSSEDRCRVFEMMDSA